MAVVQIAVIVVVVFVAVLMQLEVDYEPLLVERTVVVQGTDVDVFRMVADLPNYNKWINFITEVKELDQSKIGVGKSFEIDMYFPLFGVGQYRADITNYGQPKTLAFDTNFELLLPRTVIEISSGSRLGVSKLTWRMYSKRRSYLFCGTALPISRFILSKQLQSALFRLKLQLSHQ